MRQRLACVLLLCLGATPGLWAQQTSTPDNNAELRQEVEQLKKTLAEVEQRLAAQEKKKVELQRRLRLRQLPASRLQPPRIYKHS